MKAKEMLRPPEGLESSETPFGDVVVAASTEKERLDRVVVEKEEEERAGQLSGGKAQELSAGGGELFLPVARGRLDADHPGHAVPEVEAADENRLRRVGSLRIPRLDAGADAGIGPGLRLPSGRAQAGEGDEDGHRPAHAEEFTVSWAGELSSRIIGGG